MHTTSPPTKNGTYVQASRFNNTWPPFETHQRPLFFLVDRARGTQKCSQEKTKPDLPMIAPRYFVVSYLYERFDIGGQVDGALSVSTAVRVTDLPVAVVRLRRTKTNYSTGASKAGMITSHSHVTRAVGAINSNPCVHLFLIMRSSIVLTS